MKHRARILALTVTTAASLSVPLESQITSDARGPEPLYRITIVSRTTKALNYGHLSAPTEIKFAGTALLMGSKGSATIAPGRGSTLINAKFSDVPPPTRFGAQYLTYVVWAISPEGRAQNLGELTLDGSNKGKLNTSSPLQAFALIVTAEPYYSVTQPSDVVVMENVVGPGTVGKVEEVNATYELMPRKSFTYQPGAPVANAPGGKPVSRDEYDAILALYQAQNALELAGADGADRYAPDRMARARRLYERARTYSKSQKNEITSLAREVTQIASDSRAIAIKRAGDERVTAEAARLRAETEQRQTTADRVATPPPTTPVASPPPPPPSSPSPAPATLPPAASSTPEPRSESAIEVNPRQFQQQDPQAREHRALLLTALRRTFETIDTPRGLVITIPDSLADSVALTSRMNVLAMALRPYPALHFEVEGHSDRPELAVTQRRAENVRRAMIASGLAPDLILARGMGNQKLLNSTATEAGRLQNQRVEVVIAGDSIGTLPTWDRTYSLGSPRR